MLSYVKPVTREFLRIKFSDFPLTMVRSQFDIFKKMWPFLKVQKHQLYDD